MNESKIIITCTHTGESHEIPVGATFGDLFRFWPQDWSLPNSGFILVDENGTGWHPPCDRKIRDTDHISGFAISLAGQEVQS